MLRFKFHHKISSWSTGVVWLYWYIPPGNKLILTHAVICRHMTPKCHNKIANHIAVSFPMVQSRNWCRLIHQMSINSTCSYIIRTWHKPQTVCERALRLHISYIVFLRFKDHKNIDYCSIIFNICQIHGHTLLGKRCTKYVTTQIINLHHKCLLLTEKHCDWIVDFWLYPGLFVRCNYSSTVWLSWL